MNPTLREVHKAEIKRRLNYGYYLFAKGFYTAAMFAGFIAGMLVLWPIVLISYLFFVTCAIKGSIDREKISVWDRVIIGWSQYIYLFTAGFLASLSIFKGWGIAFAVLIPLLTPAPLYYYNKKMHFKSYYFKVARKYLCEISKYPGRAQ